MSLSNFDLLKCKQVLKTSEGFRQWQRDSQPITVSDVKAKPPGHPISSHLRGATSTSNKTKFCSLDEMAQALVLVLNSSKGRQVLGRLGPGMRERLELTILRTFRIQITRNHAEHRTFDQRDLARFGIFQTTCCAVLECRQRSELYLHIQTFYPKLTPVQIKQLWDSRQ
jgi:hypothetical protein